MANFITEFFKKSVSEITIEDITALFASPQIETPTLEFKSGEASPEKIYREITALHNTDGGLLIFGAPRERDKKCYGELIPSKQKKLALLQGIGSNIVPPPIGIHVHEIECGEGCVYLIDVPKSLNPPHQYNGCYYVRFDEESKPAPHGFVQAMFQLRRSPVLNAIIEVTKLGDIRREVSLAIENTALHPASRIGFVIYIHDAVNLSSDFSFRHQDLIDNAWCKVYNGMSEGVLVKGLWVYPVKFTIDLLIPYFYTIVMVWSGESQLQKFHLFYDDIEDQLDVLQDDDGDQSEAAFEEHRKKFLSLLNGRRIFKKMSKDQITKFLNVEARGEDEDQISDNLS